MQPSKFLRIPSVYHYKLVTVLSFEGQLSCLIPTYLKKWQNKSDGNLLPRDDPLDDVESA